ncbi:MAG TPA: hypothetical protein VKU19_01385 [Bryobacteraceae bacterium]|nr:hypothetical protein [Bryobacteraceae bacterium]
MKTVLGVLVLASVSLPCAGAQTGGQKILTNQDILMLAKAGFTEDLILTAIQLGRTRFDTSAAALADLAKEGLNERVVRAMAGAGSGVPSESASRSADVAASPAPAPLYPEEMVLPGVEPKTRTQVVKPSRVGLAIAAQTPYYESTSLLFGLYHKRVAVGAVPRRDQILSPQIGGEAGSSRMMANFPTLVAPAGSGVRYVIIP